MFQIIGSPEISLPGSSSVCRDRTCLLYGLHKRQKKEKGGIRLERAQASREIRKELTVKKVSLYGPRYDEV